jgi:HEPN domain-containing protein
MKQPTEFWLKKSDGDFKMMRSLMDSNDPAQFDGVCFHAQQSIEKLLKALCIELDIKFRRTHDLEELLELLVSNYPSLRLIQVELRKLTELGGDFRYPDEFATQFEASQAVDLCVKCRETILALLGPREGRLFP